MLDPVNNGEMGRENRSLRNNNNSLENKNQPNDLQQLLQGIVNILAQSQKSQIDFEEQTFVKIPTYARGNQDPVEWLELVNSAFEVNRIVGTRKLAVASASLTDLAAFWWEDRKGREPRILYWDNECGQDRSFVHQFLLNFCTSIMLARWNKELLTRRQGAIETVD